MHQPEKKRSDNANDRADDVDGTNADRGRSKRDSPGILE